MRVWGYADPRLLNTKHILGEHREVHALLPQINGWSKHPEYARFHTHGKAYRKGKTTNIIFERAWLPGLPVDTRLELKQTSKKGISFLVLRHECLRLAMNVRYSGRHTETRHPTPLAYTKHLTKSHYKFLQLYYKELKIHPTLPAHETSNDWFAHHMVKLGFPPVNLPGKGGLADTPWDRDNLTLEEYIALGNGWNKKQHHIANSSNDPNDPHYKPDYDRGPDTIKGWTKPHPVKKTKKRKKKKQKKS